MTFDFHLNHSDDEILIFAEPQPTRSIEIVPTPSLWVPPEPLNVMSILRPHQLEMVEQVRALLRAGHKRVMVMAPTGAGKSKFAAGIMQKAVRRGWRVALTVPFLSLIEQFIDDLLEMGITDLGVVQANHALTDPSQPIQICSIDTLARRGLPNVDLVIVDEAHIHKTILSDWMGRPEWQDTPFIGLSATPGTRGLGRHYTDLVSVVTTQELIDRGLLSPFRVFAPGAPDLSGVKTVRGDYLAGQLATAMSPLTADIVSTWLKLGNNEPTLVFAVNRVHAQELRDAFEAVGVPTGYRDAYTGSEERKEQARQFKAGEIKVMTNVGTLTTGVDWDVRCLILARPTKSPALYCQIIGRALRTADGKEYATVLDHTSTTQRLGFVTDIHFTLDDGSPKKAKPRTAAEQGPELPKECPSCKLLRPLKVTLCPACGHEAKPKSKIECADGELVEVTKLKAAEPTRDEMQRWWSMLLWIETQRGYKPGWRFHTFRQKFPGADPRALKLDSRASIEADAVVTNYLRHLQIRRSLARKRAA